MEWAGHALAQSISHKISDHMYKKFYEKGSTRIHKSPKQFLNNFSLPYPRPGHMFTRPCFHQAHDDQKIPSRKTKRYQRVPGKIPRLQQKSRNIPSLFVQIIHTSLPSRAMPPHLLPQSYGEVADRAGIGIVIARFRGYGHVGSLSLTPINPILSASGTGVNSTTSIISR